MGSISALILVKLQTFKKIVMKAFNRIITLVLSLLLISNQAITADLDDINGSWEGLFMDQFKVVLQFNN